MEFRSPAWGRVRCLFECPIMNEHKWAKVPSIPADAFILDLEDAAPAPLKEQARARVVEYLGRPEYFGGRLAVPRANGLDTPWGRDDLIALARAGVTTLMYPKIDTLDEVNEVISICEENGASPELVASIESMRGVLDADAIFSHPSIVATTFGPGDLHVDAGIPLYGPDGTLNHAFEWAKLETVFAAKSQGVAALSIAFAPDLKDLVEIRRQIEGDHRLGFTGYCSFYPPQVPIINEVFTPSEEEIARAREIVRVYDEAIAAGNPAVQLPTGEAVLLHQYKDANHLLARVDA